MKPIDPPDSTQQETNVNTNQEITNSEESIDLQTRFDEALWTLGNAVAAITAINQARDIDGGDSQQRDVRRNRRAR